MLRTARLATAAAVVATAAGLAPTAAFAVKPSASAGASCSYSSNVVSAANLPTDQVVNFQMTDANGTDSWVIGTTWDGKAFVDVPTPNGATTYQFISKQWGPNGSKYNVFATCSA